MNDESNLFSPDRKKNEPPASVGWTIGIIIAMPFLGVSAGFAVYLFRWVSGL